MLKDATWSMGSNMMHLRLTRPTEHHQTPSTDRTSEMDMWKALWCRAPMSEATICPTVECDGRDLGIVLINMISTSQLSLHGLHNEEPKLNCTDYDRYHNMLIYSLYLFLAAFGWVSSHLLAACEPVRTLLIWQQNTHCNILNIVCLRNHTWSPWSKIDNSGMFSDTLWLWLT